MSDSRGRATPEQIARRHPDDPARHFLIYCDESGIHGTRFVGWGSLWMPWERRGDFQQIWSDLEQAHFHEGEAKWHKVKERTLPFYKALVDEFFKRSWLMFHCLVTERAAVDLARHGGDWDLARRKHFTLLLANKIRRFAAPGKKYRIRVDPIASRYSKADQAAEIILRRILQRQPALRGHDVIHSVTTVDSKTNRGVQLSDLLLGAVMAARQGDVTAAAKLELIAHVARCLGRPNLTEDMYPAVKKFNIWRFWDPTSGEPRPEKTRR